MRALLVHNEDAGTDPVPRLEIEKVLQEAGITPIYCKHGVDSLSDALSGTFDFVIAAGGDGTVAHVVSELDDIHVPIGILPLGGSNNIANAVGVDGNWRTIPRQWSLDRWTRLDRCEAEGPWGHRKFVEGLGSGVLMEAFEEVDDAPHTPEEKQANGRAAFRRALAGAAPFNCRIEAAEWLWEGECLMVEVLNIQFVGSRLSFASRASPDDGLLDVVLITPELRTSVLEWALDPDASDCPVKSRQTSSVQMTVLERPFRVDDRSPNEYLAGTVRIFVRENPVKVLKPKELAQ